MFKITQAQIDQIANAMNDMPTRVGLPVIDTLRQIVYAGKIAEEPVAVEAPVQKVVDELTNLKGK